jgi:hypothetical protein
MVPRCGIGRPSYKRGRASPDERALFAEAKNNGQSSDGLILVYLVKVGRRRGRRATCRPRRLSAGPHLIC